MRVHVRETKVDLSALDHAILTRLPLLYTRPDLQPPLFEVYTFIGEERSPDALRRPGGALTTVREVRIPKDRNWIGLSHCISADPILLGLTGVLFFSKAT